MRASRVSSAAAIVAACLWVHVEAQDATHLLSTPSPPVKTAPAPLAPPVSNRRPPFAVVDAKRGDIPNDLAVADALGIKPVKITNAASIEGIAPHGQAFKWVLSEDGQLWGLPMLDRHLVFTEKDRDIIKYDIVTRGGRVSSAGKGQLRGDTLRIDSQSGHYHPTRESVEQLAEPAFKAAGFANVETCDNILSE